MQTSTILVAEIHGRPPQYRRDDFTEISLASGEDESSRAAESATVPGTALPAALHSDPTIRASIVFSLGTRHDRRPPGRRAFLPCDVGSQLGP